MGGYTFLKSPLAIDPDTRAGTTVEVVAPASARLFASDWAHWAGRVTVADIIAGARRTLVVGDCHFDEPQMLPGGLVVAGPSCVTLTITRPGSPEKIATLKVPVARDCP